MGWDAAAAEIETQTMKSYIGFVAFFLSVGIGLGWLTFFLQAKPTPVHSPPEVWNSGYSIFLEETNRVGKHEYVILKDLRTDHHYLVIDGRAVIELRGRL